MGISWFHRLRRVRTFQLLRKALRCPSMSTHSWAAALLLVCLVTFPSAAVGLESVEASPVVTVPGSVASITVEGTPTVALSPATIHELASDIASATPAQTTSMSVVGTLPVSVVSVGSWDSMALNALVVLAAMLTGALFTSMIAGRGSRWKL